MLVLLPTLRIFELSASFLMDTGSDEEDMTLIMSSLSLSTTFYGPA